MCSPPLPHPLSSSFCLLQFRCRRMTFLTRKSQISRRVPDLNAAPGLLIMFVMWKNNSIVSGCHHFILVLPIPTDPGSAGVGISGTSKHSRSLSLLKFNVSDKDVSLESLTDDGWRLWTMADSRACSLPKSQSKKYPHGRQPKLKVVCSVAGCLS